MFREKTQKDELTDRIGQVVLRSAASTDEETEAASSPFLYSRVRAAIAERGQAAEDGAGWLTMLFVARQAIPAMALIAVMVGLLTVWSAQFSGPSAWYRLDDEALTDTRDPGIEQTILATRNNLSPDEVLSIVVNEREQR